MLHQLSNPNSAGNRKRNTVNYEVTSIRPDKVPTSAISPCYLSEQPCEGQHASGPFPHRVRSGQTSYRIKSLGPRMNKPSAARFSSYTDCSGRSRTIGVLVGMLYI